MWFMPSPRHKVRVSGTRADVLSPVNTQLSFLKKRTSVCIIVEHPVFAGMTSGSSDLEK